MYAEEGYGKYVPFGEQIWRLMRANTLLMEDIQERLAADREVVVEQTFCKAERRIVYIDEIRSSFPDAFIAVYVMCPNDELWQSNIRKRELERDFPQIREARNEIEFPNVSEGFNAIYQVMDGMAELRREEEDGRLAGLFLLGHHGGDLCMTSFHPER